MNGWKTKFGATGLFFTGLGTAISGIDLETMTFDGTKLTTGCGMMGAAFTTWGIGHKLEKGPVSPEE